MRKYARISKTIYETCPDFASATNLSPMQFGGMVKTWRLQNGFNREGLAMRLGVSVAWIGNIENGMRNKPFANLFVNFLDMMGMRASDIRSLMWSYCIDDVSRYNGSAEEAVLRIALEESGITGDVADIVLGKFRRRYTFGKFETGEKPAQP